MKVLIAAGGTAGHTIPGLAVAEKLKEEDKNTEILFITSRKKQDYDLISKKGFSVKKILSGKFRRYFSIYNFTDIISFIIGFFQSFFIVLKFKPDVVFSKGSYVSFPVVLASRVLGRKILIHESDCKLGLANRWSIPFIDKLDVSFPLMFYKDINEKKLFFSGNPLKKLTIEEKLHSETKTLLVMGGSQGAKKINYAILEVLEELLGRIKIVHLVGKLDIDDFKKKKESLREGYKENYVVYDSVFDEKEYSKLLNESDIIISRAGANTISEVAFFKKPTILIPLPGHQEKNANFFETKKAVLVIRDEDLEPDILRNKISDLTNNEKLFNELSNNISKLVSLSATSVLVKELVSLSKK